MSNRDTLSNRYRLVSKIGAGGMAEVYLATDLLLNRAVAVKMLHPRFTGDREFVERFRREAQAAASLSHPNVVNIYDVGEDGGSHYIVLEYVKGRNLKDILRRYGPLPFRQAAFVARAVTAALAAAHRQGLVHRDVKPHNILITDEGRVKVTDFGIARAASSATLTETGSLIGSVHYFSPEQARGAPSGPQSDLYSLGVVLYEMLTGRVPFTGDTPVAVALKHLQEDPVPPSHYRRRLPPQLEAIVLKAMAKDPGDRYASADALLADLRRFSREYHEEDGEEPLFEDEPGSLPWPGAARPVEGGAPAGDPAAEDEPTIVMTDPGLVLEQGDGPGTKTVRLRRRRGKRWRWGLVAAILILGYVGITQGAPRMLNWIFPPEVAVPDVVGLHLDEAREVLRQAGLELALERRVHHSEVPEFHVIAQHPQPQRTVKMRRAIQVAMSLGPDIAAVPDVRGMPEREARLALTQAGFVLGAVHDEFQPDVEPNVVTGQQPAPGSDLERGRPVDLWVARPDREVAQVALPDFRGLFLRDVEGQLAELGLQVGNLWPEVAAQLPAGRVIDQNPAPGHLLEVGGTVDLVYSEVPPSRAQGAGQAPALAEGVPAGGDPASGAPAAPAEPAPAPPPVERQRAEVSIYVPEGPPQEVVIIVIDDFGAREVFRDTLSGGLRTQVVVEGRGSQARVQVYMGGAMVQDRRLSDRE